jgi:hypothetical protein
MSRPEMSFARPAIRLSSGPSTPPGNSASGGPSAAEASLPCYWMQENDISSQGQCTPAPEEDSWTRWRDRGRLSFWDDYTITGILYPVLRTDLLEKLVLSLETLNSHYAWISSTIDLQNAVGELQSSRQEQRERHDADTDQDHEFDQSQDELPRLCQDILRDAYNELPAALAAVEEMRIAWDAAKIDVPYESENEMPNREAAMNWPQSQQRALICSLRGTVLIVRAGHSAWKSTKHM